MKDIQLKIAVWTNDRYFPPLYDANLNLEKRVELLEDAVDKARQWFGSVPDRPGHETLKIFIAPENLLIDSRQVGEVTEKAHALSFQAFQAYCQEDKLTKLCEGRLAELSRELLMIPGTVLLKKPMPSSVTARLDRLESRYQQYYSQQYKDSGSIPSQFAARERVQVERKLTHIQEKVEKVPEQERDVQMVRNVALVFFDRHLVFKYKKQAEYKSGGAPTGEFTKGDKAEHTAIKFIPGHKEGVFQLQVGEASLTCGIEVCMDHNTGQLRFTEGGKKLHLQFIVSDRVSNKVENSAVHEGGYIIHASTDKDASGVFDHAFKPVGPTLPPTKVKVGVLHFREQILKPHLG